VSRHQDIGGVLASPADLDDVKSSPAPARPITFYRPTFIPPEDRDPCDVRFDVSAAINAGYGPRKRSPTAERRR